MLHVIRCTLFTCVAVVGMAVGLVFAQTPAQPAAAPPAGPWTGSAGAGLTLNRGNSDTTNFNVTFDATHDPKKDSVWKFKGLYMRGETNGDLAVDRVLLEGRYERNLTDRVYAFGQLQVLHDQFKQIDYLWAPSGGVGYKFVATPQTTLSADAGLGVKWEKDIGLDLRTDTLVTGSDKFEHKLSAAASLTQGFNALWKASDFGDALYTFTAGAAAALTARTQLKVEFLDAYATRPPSETVKKNDTSLLAAVVFKF